MSPLSPDDATTIVYLVRHGATASNEQRPYVLQGNSVDHSLSETGRDQAIRVGRFLSELPISRVFCSNLLRAKETATEIASHHQLAIEVIEPLHEVDVGEWEGMNWDDIMKQSPDAYERFMADPWTNAYPAGESYGDVNRRVMPHVESLCEAHRGRSIAIVAHNVVNRAILAPLIGAPLAEAKSIKQTNTGTNVLRSRPGELELITLNACFHLA